VLAGTARREHQCHDCTEDEQFAFQRSSLGLVGCQLPCLADHEDPEGDAEQSDECIERSAPLDLRNEHEAADGRECCTRDGQDESCRRDACVCFVLVHLPRCTDEAQQEDDTTAEQQTPRRDVGLITTRFGSVEPDPDRPASDDTTDGENRCHEGQQILADHETLLPLRGNLLANTHG